MPQTTQQEANLIEKLAGDALAAKPGAEKAILDELASLTPQQNRDLAKYLNSDITLKVPLVKCETDKNGVITQLTFIPSVFDGNVSERIDVNKRIAVREPYSGRVTPPIIKAELMLIEK